MLISNTFNAASLFDEFHPEPPATTEQLADLAAQLPQALPASYHQFLLASNGGWGRSGTREFGFFGTEELIRYWQDYEFGEYMPGALPFALNGGGIFYVFDVRNAPLVADTAVFTCDSDANTWDTASWLAASFQEACQGRH
jgi:hypothetical protein